MGNVATNGDPQAFQMADTAADGQRIEQRLGGVFVGPVTGIQHGAGNFSRQQGHRAAIGVAHDQQVWVHGVQGDRSIKQGFAFIHGRGGDAHIHHIGTEALSGQLERALCTGRTFKKQVDLRAAAQARLLLIPLSVMLDIGIRIIKEAGNI